MILTLEGLLMTLSPSHKENSEVLKASIVLFTSILFIYTVTEKLWWRNRCLFIFTFHGHFCQIARSFYNSMLVELFRNKPCFYLEPFVKTVQHWTDYLKSWHAWSLPAQALSLILWLDLISGLCGHGQMAFKWFKLIWLINLLQDLLHFTGQDT